MIQLQHKHQWMPFLQWMKSQLQQYSYNNSGTAKHLHYYLSLPTSVWKQWASMNPTSTTSTSVISMLEWSLLSSYQGEHPFFTSLFPFLLLPPPLPFRSQLGLLAKAPPSAASARHLLHPLPSALVPLTLHFINSNWPSIPASLLHLYLVDPNAHGWCFLHALHCTCGFFLWPAPYPCVLIRTSRYLECMNISFPNK